MAHRPHDGIPLLSGPIPGLLDASQCSRLLRTPTCSLYFAAFDPHTARGDPTPVLQGLHIHLESSSKHTNPEAFASTNGKRVVIETDFENGTCSWRFVPRAKVDSDLFTDEGPWPRVVELDGRLVRMTQDQWDIHKLDPEYDCVVYAPPSFSTITRVSRVQPDSTWSSDVPVTPAMTQSSLDNTPTPTVKRAGSPTSQYESPRKKYKQPSVDLDHMAIDGDPFFVPVTPKAQAEYIVNDKKRRRAPERLGPFSASDAGPSKSQPSSKPTSTSVFADLSLNDRSRSRETPPTTTKRFRSRSPGAVRREIEQKRVEREKKRKADMDARVKARQDMLHEAFWRGIGIVHLDGRERPEHMSETGSFETSANDDELRNASDPPTEFEDNEEASRLAAIEASRRKLAELEKDKPLWEESARKRQQREAEEELSRRRAKAMREEEQRLQEILGAARKRHEEQLEVERRERDRQSCIAELRGRMFVTQPRDSFRWNARLALERYIRTSADFDVTKFSSVERPMSFAQIPWPVLHASFSVQDVDWDAVETFFAGVQRFLTPSELKELMEKSHRRFHPDRWRSRGLLASVHNETERDLLEVTGSTVAQALTPLWKEVTGR